MLHKILMVLLILTCFSQARTWRNKDASRSFEGDYISHTKKKVTIARTSGEEITFSLERLHSEDIQWIKEQSNTGDTETSPAFEKLNFGDSRKTVVEKLKTSKIVATDVNSTLTGRTGLNGIYQTKEQIGGYTYALFFGWTNADTLKEIEIRSEPQSKETYNTQLKKSWEELVGQLSEIYGEPLMAAALPKHEDMDEGSSMSSHLWRIETGGSVLLGIGLTNGQYVITTTITRKHITAPR